jgi:hypothetical protein
MIKFTPVRKKQRKIWVKRPFRRDCPQFRGQGRAAMVNQSWDCPFCCTFAARARGTKEVVWSGRLTSRQRAVSLSCFLGHNGSCGGTDRDQSARRPLAFCTGYGVDVSHQRDFGGVDRADSGGILARSTMGNEGIMPHNWGNTWIHHGLIEFVAIDETARLESAPSLRRYSCSVG